jgi:hypothetical protein
LSTKFFFKPYLIASALAASNHALLSVGKWCASASTKTLAFDLATSVQNSFEG